MLTTIKKLIDKLFAQRNAVEEFIVSKNPQTAADVEHWARVYAQKNGGWSV